MWSITGMFAIPKEPQLKIVKTNNSGYFLNFRCVTQGRGTDNAWQPWNCSMWIPEDTLEDWKSRIISGNVLYAEHACVTSFPLADGKYHGTSIKLEHSKTRHLSQPMWAQKQ